jgi:hypothetical protein
MLKKNITTLPYINFGFPKKRKKRTLTYYSLIYFIIQNFPGFKKKTHTAPKIMIWISKKIIKKK